MSRATIYLRQSQDKDGTRAAVDRQLDECRALCEERGWTVSEVLSDNDISATTGKRRPGFERLLRSNPERVVVWHVDRLVRLSKDLERVIELGVNVYAVKSGHIDLSTPAGRAVAKTVTAWAQYEGEQKATRQVAANRQRAQRGVVLWSRRPFGFQRAGNKVSVVKTEARELRQAAKKVLAGQSLASIARDLDERGIRTASGSTWSVTSLRRALTNPRVAGRVVSKGVDYGTGGPRILDADTFDRVAALLTHPGRRTAPSTSVRYLLSGLVRCGRQGCDDAPMFATCDAAGRMVYRCRRCYGVRGLEQVDAVVWGVLMARLARPDAAGLLRSDVDLDEMRARVVSLRERRDGLAELLSEGLLSRESVREQAKRLRAEIETVELALDAAESDSPLVSIVGCADVEDALSRLPLLKQREVIRSLMNVRIMPAGKGIRFDPEHVSIEWRA